MIYVIGMIVFAMCSVSLETRSVTDIRPPCYNNDFDTQVKENYPLRYFLKKISDQTFELKVRIALRSEEVCNTVTLRLF